MPTYAMQDEYLAGARYEQAIAKFGKHKPFTNIITAEATHIAHLKPLFSGYKVPVPADNAKNYVTVESFSAKFAQIPKHVVFYVPAI